ncbi:class A beta-lactamase, subclass A2 [Sphingobacterium sp. UBA6320]|uniref:class A beta-lactamase, subclass A2 n=1 Tax=Sphingobacterium sp. UBA6320 TaxID=1947510 RepID=UPI0039C9DA32
MLKSTYIIIIIFFLSFTSYAQNMDGLQQHINQIITGKNALVGVAISGISQNDTVGVQASQRLPMQSVFKFPLAIVMLTEIDKGNFTLDQKIEITKRDLTPEIWSPIRDKYPDGVTLTLREILEYTITLSDNIGCDVMLKLLGGPQKVEQYFAKQGFKNISIKINEKTMQSNWDKQFLNWCTPQEMNNILKTFYVNKNNLLSMSMYDFLWSTMKSTNTGLNQIKGQLPAGTVVAHKTGSSGRNKDTDVTAALNDVGIVSLPNGEYFVISIFVTNSKESKETNERMISDIAKVTWDYFTGINNRN